MPDNKANRANLSVGRAIPAGGHVRPTGSRAALNPSDLKRARPSGPEPLPDPEPKPVSGGPVDKVLDLAFNPSREKIREVTIIDRLQGRFLPLLDTVNALTRYTIEIATFRQDADNYRAVYKKDKPDPPDIIDELMYRLAQWQKSVAGKNLERATDIALAETETRGGDEEGAPGGGDAWAEK